MIELRALGTLDLTAPTIPSAPELLSKSVPTALLVYLAVASPGSFHRRDHLLSLFWPESQQAQARANLRKVVHTIRAALGATVIEARGDEELRLAKDVVWCDAVEFQQAIRTSQLRSAMDLYQGPLLPGLHVDGATEFIRWLDDTRRELGREAAKAAIRLAQQYLGNSERTLASDLAQRIGRIGSALDDEYLFRKLLQLLGELGDHAGALKMYATFTERLEREYGALPAPDTRALIASIRGH